jgi:aminopeptidase N
MPASTVSPDTAPDPALDPSADPDGIGDTLFPGLGNPGLDVQHYDLDLSYDHASTKVSANLGIDVRFTEDRAQFTLDSSGPQIDAVTVDGAPAQFDSGGDELRITPPQPEAKGVLAHVQVHYHFTGDESGGGFPPSGWFNTAGGSYVLDEPDGARRWLPSDDHPSDKATFHVTIHVPTGVTGVANGALVAHTTAGGVDTWVWDEDRPMATYLIQLLTGDYAIIDATGPHGLPLTSAVLRSDVARMTPLVDGIGDQIAVLEQFFGPYPLERYGLAIGDSDAQVAMETQERSQFSDHSLTGDPAADRSVLAHELSHQWFGDAVTPRHWSDVWLNESFATYGEWLAEFQSSRSASGDAVQAVAADALSHRPPGATADPTVDALFGTDVYTGGAVALEALRLTIGDDEFFDLLQRWVTDNTGTSRSTADFVALAEQVSGTDLTTFFHDWIYSVQPPKQLPKPARVPATGTSPTTSTSAAAVPTTGG